MNTSVQATGDMTLTVNEETNNQALLDIQRHLQAQDKSLDIFGMPMPHEVEYAPEFATQTEAHEREYNCTQLSALVQDRLALIADNPGQLQAWTAIQAALQDTAPSKVTVLPAMPVVLALLPACHLHCSCCYCCCCCHCCCCCSSCCYFRCCCYCFCCG